MITGYPDLGAEIQWHEVALASRRLRVRVYRPKAAQGNGATVLPLVLHVHGGGLVAASASPQPKEQPCRLSDLAISGRMFQGSTAPSPNRPSNLAQPAVRGSIDNPEDMGLLPSAVRASAPRERGTRESGAYSAGNFHAWNIRLRPYLETVSER